METLLQILDRVTDFAKREADFRCLASIDIRSLELFLRIMSP